MPQWGTTKDENASAILSGKQGARMIMSPLFLNQTFSSVISVSLWCVFVIPTP